MNWLILAGGLGERIFPFSSITPKCLLPINGVPCVRHITDKLQDEGYDDIVLCINRWAEPHFKHEFRDTNIKFSISEGGLGTAGEIFTARKLITDTFGLIYGDDLTSMDHKGLETYHRKQADASGTLALTDNVPLEVGVIDIDKNNVINRFQEKPMINKPIWTGIAVLEPEILNYVAPGKDVARDIFPKMIAEDKKLYGYLTHDLWLDIGNFAHFKRTEELLKSV